MVPAELRLIIFEDCLEESVWRNGTIPNLIKALRIDPRLHAEAMEMFNKKTTFVVEYRDPQLPRIVPCEVGMKQLRHLIIALILPPKSGSGRVVLNGMGNAYPKATKQEQLQFLGVLMTKLSSLQTVTIGITESDIVDLAEVCWRILGKKRLTRLELTLWGAPRPIKVTGTPGAIRLKADLDSILDLDGMATVGAGDIEQYIAMGLLTWQAPRGHALNWAK